MKKIFFLAILLFGLTMLHAQHTLLITVKDAKDRTALPGTTIRIQSPLRNQIADDTGQTLLENLATGHLSIRVSHIGYVDTAFVFMIPADTSLTVFLQEQTKEENEVVITSTRTGQYISLSPTRVETLSGEELGEKANMKPGDIRMLLSESTGIQTQQTSAVSGDAGIRIQGLDSRYTQIIRDGFPLYSGFSGGLGLLQIAPLDLQQVEVIKGSTSTLYGGGAIAGLVNLVSKLPKRQRELGFMLNGTTAGGLDASGFYSRRNDKVGTTIFGSYNHGTAYAPSHIGLSAIPNFNRYTFNPKLFLYFGEHTKASLGLNTTYENRIGGDMQYLKGRGDSIHSYFEKNITKRFSTQLSVEHNVDDRWKLQFKNSISYYDRSLRIPDFYFGGRQLSSYSELNFSYAGKKNFWTGGANLLTDGFTQNRTDTAVSLNYYQHTWGIFVQNTLHIADWLTTETGLRADHHDEYGTFLLPRLSALFTINKHFSSRLGGGMGYVVPNVFTDDAERIQFRNILPINTKQNEAEKSYGGNFDITYKTVFDFGLSLNINQLFFYTNVHRPLELTPFTDGYYAYLQSKGHLDTKGMETNVKLSYQHIALYLGYTYTDAIKHETAQEPYPLVSKNRLNNVLMYEIEDQLRMGLEAYYYSPQALNDGTIGKSYWLAGFMAEKLWERFSIFINLENLTNVRQTKFGSIYTGSITHPIFKDIYAPLDGFVMNGGIKIHL